jgi:protein-tyrosine phosphatase
MGNICRSPMAEAIFAHLVNEAGLADRFEIASAGTSSYHVGEAPHRGTQAILAKHHVAQTGNHAQQVTPRMLAGADYVVAMDEDNLRSLRRFDDALDGKLSLLLDHTREAYAREVPDPYYDGNFEEVYQLVLDGARGLLEHIKMEVGD